MLDRRMTDKLIVWLRRTVAAVDNAIALVVHKVKLHKAMVVDNMVVLAGWDR